MTDDVLMSIWTVYDHPSDYPDHFVARRVEIVAGELEPRQTSDFYLAHDFEALEQHFLRIGLSFLPRFEQDEPQIMGVWL